MGTIADKLTYLNGTKTALRDAINAAGGNLTVDDTFRSYASGWLRDQSATLSLDFANQQYVAKDLTTKFPDRVGFSNIVTFSRASTGTYFDASGVLQVAAVNQPRFDHDPVTGEPLGILIEEQRTNLLLRSEQFADAYWTKTDATLIVDAELSPDGTISADKMIPVLGAVKFTRVSRTFSVTAGTSYSFSIRVKPAELRYMRVLSAGGTASTVEAYFDTQLVSFSNVSGATATVKQVGNGFVECSISFPATLSATATFFAQVVSFPGVPNITGDGTSGIYIWGAQLEAGSFPTSYIPTEASQVTRAADVCGVNTLSPWYNASEGTLFVEWVQPAVKVGQQTVFDLNDGTTSNRIAGLIESNSSIFQSRYASGGSILPNRSAPPAVPGTNCRSALSYSDGAQEFAFNGAIFGTGTTAGTLGLVSAMRVGGGLGGTLNSHIRSLRYFPRRLTDSELQAITA